jgi:hypothetical protein
MSLQDEITVTPIDDYITIEDNYIIKTPEPTSSIDLSVTEIVFCNPQNKCIGIDFSGDSLVYSGDLGVDEAARIFFDAVFKIYKEEIGNEPKN